MLKSSDRSSQQGYYYNLLQHWISQYKFAIWGGMCAGAIAVCTLSAINLFSAGAIEPDPPPQPKPSAIQENALPEAPMLSEPLPLAPEKGLPASVIVFLLIACGAGTLAATYVLKWLSTAPAVPRGTKPKPKQRQVQPQGKARRARKKRPVRPTSMPPKLTAHSRTPTSSLSLAITRSTPAAAERYAPRQVSAMAPLPQSRSTAVTVVPPEEVVALDRHEPSLADMMDLRKRRTLTALVQGGKG